jgi:streptomycin 6-kinase
VHGDLHPARLVESRLGGESVWCLVDPDGFRADPAYDLGVGPRLERAADRPDARAVLEGYRRLLANRTGLDEQRIWEWGFLERVSTGLYVPAFGADEVGRRLLTSAELLLD